VATRTDSVPALTGIRPFASLLVFAFHFCRPVVKGGPGWLASLVGAGFVAVSFFFVLSGFVLAVRHHENLRDGSVDYRRFLIKRVARIYPAYAFALVLLLPLAVWPLWGAATGAFVDASAAAPAHKFGTGLLHVFMLQAWWPPVTLSWNLPGWSVSVEIACYVAFLLLGARVARRSRRQRWLLLAALWALSLAVTAAYTCWSPEARVVDADASAPLLNIVKLWPPVRVPEFLFGLTLGLLWRERDARATSMAAVTGLLGLAGVATVVVALTHASALPYAVLHNALLLPAFGAILWSVASAHGAVARVLGSRPFVAVGKATYDLYILQMPLMYWVLLGSQRAGVSLAGARFLAVFVPLVFATTVITHRFVERHARRRLARWLESVVPVVSSSGANELPRPTRLLDAG
jgi:peptidoglycan/LPS O-acetylase OafA/YrhL